MSDGTEKIAEMVHDVWARWMQYLFAQCEEGMNGDQAIPAKVAARWKRQMDTPYSALSEQEKLSDRALAEEYMQAMEPLVANGVAIAQGANSSSDVGGFGDAGIWVRLCVELIGAREYSARSTRAMCIPEVGVVLQVTTQLDNQVAEALTFIPGADITDGRIVKALPSAKEAIKRCEDDRLARGTP